jgi:hypothetical protein
MPRQKEIEIAGVEQRARKKISPWADLRHAVHIGTQHFRHDDRAAAV